MEIRSCVGMIKIILTWFNKFSIKIIHTFIKLSFPMYNEWNPSGYAVSPINEDFLKYSNICEEWYVN